jgi:hypothetical protein
VLGKLSELNASVYYCYHYHPIASQAYVYIQLITAAANEAAFFVAEQVCQCAQLTVEKPQGQKRLKNVAFSDNQYSQFHIYTVVI